MKHDSAMKFIKLVTFASAQMASETNHSNNKYINKETNTQTEAEKEKRWGKEETIKKNN